MAGKQYTIDDDFIAEFRRVLRWIRNFRGDGVTNDPERGATVKFPRDLPTPTQRQWIGNFPVKVEKTSGTAVTSATATANWVYTVRRADWTGSGTSANFELGTSLSPARPRAKGPMVFQTGDQGYGVGFYDTSGSFVLWDAGEVEDTEACS